MSYRCTHLSDLPIPSNLIQLSFINKFRSLDKSEYQKIIFLFLNQDICSGCSKEPSQYDGSVEHS